MVLEKLKSEFSQRAHKNPAYSLRAFAKSLGVHSSSLSRILSGKRQLTFPMAQKLLDRLELSQLEKKELLFQSSRETPAKALADQEMEVIAGWEHYAILSLMETKDFQSSVKYISQKLDIPFGIATAALERLIAVGLIQIKKGQYELCQQSVASTNEIPSLALRRAHRSYIEKALYSLEHHPLSERDITGVTVAIAKKNIPKAKKIIKDFRASMAELLEAGKKEEVYRLNIQLFPLKK